MDTTIYNIPVEILIFIFQYMDFDSRKACKLVCTLWFDILMTKFEFKNDRNLKLANCSFDKTKRSPVSIFSKSKYKYETSFISIEMDSTMKLVVMKKDITYKFWNNIGITTLRIENTIYLRDWYREINNINSLQILIIDSFSDFLVNEFISQKLCFPKIKTVSIQHSNSQLYKLNFSKSFPNLEKLWIENVYSTITSTKNITLSNIPNIKNVWLDYENYEIDTKIPFKYENLYLKQNIYLPEFYEYLENVKSNLVHTLTLQSHENTQYKIPNNHPDVWSMYKNVKKIKLTFMRPQNCFFAHQILSFPLEVLEMDYIFVETYCLMCLNSLLNSFEQIKVLKLNLDTGKYFNFKLILDTWTCLQEIDLTIYCNHTDHQSIIEKFFNISSYSKKYHTMKKIKLICLGTLDFKDMYRIFPNLQILDVKLFTKTETSYFYDLKKLIPKDNCQLKYIKYHISCKTFEKFGYLGDIVNHIITYGKKLRVSIFIYHFIYVIF